MAKRKKIRKRNYKNKEQRFFQGVEGEPKENKEKVQEVISSKKRRNSFSK